MRAFEWKVKGQRKKSHKEKGEEKTEQEDERRMLFLSREWRYFL